MILLLEESVLTAGPVPCDAKISRTEIPRDPLILGGNHRY